MSVTTFYLALCIEPDQVLKKPLLVAEKSKRENPLHDIYLVYEFDIYLTKRNYMTL